MRRVLLHLGLHKTGTTAAQSFLHENRVLIWPQYALVLPYKTRKTGLADAATRHSVYRLDSTLSEFGNRMHDFLGNLDFGARRGLILSEENFSGLRPSRNSAEGYGAAPDLAATLVHLIQSRFEGQEIDLTLYLSLRQRGSWLRSLWAHDLQRTRLVQDFDDFREALDHLPSLQDTANRIREKLPLITVQTEWLEDLQLRRFGPGTPFAEFMGLPEDRIVQDTASRALNSGLPVDAQTELLSLNRSALDDTALIAQKKAVVETARKQMIRQT